MGKRIFVIIVVLLLIPIRVKAIICNDGHSSSCRDCHQGCCSGHGGCTDNPNNGYGGGGGYVPENTYVEPVQENTSVPDDPPVQDVEPIIEESPPEEFNTEELDEEEEEDSDTTENEEDDSDDNDYDISDSDDEGLYTILGYGILGSVVFGSFASMVLNDKKENKKGLFSKKKKKKFKFKK